MKKLGKFEKVGKEVHVFVDEDKYKVFLVVDDTRVDAYARVTDKVNYFEIIDREKNAIFGKDESCSLKLTSDIAIDAKQMLDKLNPIVDW